MPHCPVSGMGHSANAFIAAKRLAPSAWPQSLGLDIALPVRNCSNNMAVERLQSRPQNATKFFLSRTVNFASLQLSELLRRPAMRSSQPKWRRGIAGGELRFTLWFHRQDYGDGQCRYASGSDCGLLPSTPVPPMSTPEVGSIIPATFERVYFALASFGMC